MHIKAVCCCVLKLLTIHYDRRSELLALYRRYVAEGMPSDLSLFYVSEAAKAPVTLGEFEQEGVLTHEADELGEAQ